MAILNGSSGSIRIAANTIAEMDEWTLDIDRNLVQSHAFGDTWEENTATTGKWSGSAKGRLDTSDTNGHIAARTALLAGTVLAMRFYEDGTHYYAGNAFVKASFGANENGLVEVSYSFTGTGAIAYT